MIYAKRNASLCDQGNIPAIPGSFAAQKVRNRQRRSCKMEAALLKRNQARYSISRPTENSQRASSPPPAIGAGDLSCPPCSTIFPGMTTQTLPPVSVTLASDSSAPVNNPALVNHETPLVEKAISRSWRESQPFAPKSMTG